MIDFRKLQLEIREWEKHNFPDATAVDQLLGVAEEVGELCHAVLKFNQKIRAGAGRVETWNLIRDAVGDVVIFLTNFCDMLGIDFAEVVEETWVTYRDWETQ